MEKAGRRRTGRPARRRPGRGLRDRASGRWRSRRIGLSGIGAGPADVEVEAYVVGQVRPDAGISRTGSIPAAASSSAGPSGSQEQRTAVRARCRITRAPRTSVHRRGARLRRDRADQTRRRRVGADPAGQRAPHRAGIPRRRASRARVLIGIGPTPIGSGALWSATAANPACSSAPRRPGGSDGGSPGTASPAADPPPCQGAPQLGVGLIAEGRQDVRQAQPGLPAAATRRSPRAPRELRSG
jgi:hypothetical protein